MEKFTRGDQICVGCIAADHLFAETWCMMVLSLAALEDLEIFLRRSSTPLLLGCDTGWPPPAQGSEFQGTCFRLSAALRSRH